MDFVELKKDDKWNIAAMSAMATEIVREHFDPIIGKAQNDYMIGKFQTTEAISEQLEEGYQYYFVENEGRIVGFLAFYSRGTAMYLSKFYLYKTERGRGYSRQMLDFVLSEAKSSGLRSIELNVNRNNDAIYAYESMGFRVIREEKNDIGQGYFMDDYVYSLEL